MICRFVRKNVYPEIKFKFHHNVKYRKNDLLDVLTHISMTHDFTENGSHTFKLINEVSPDADTILYHIKKLD